MARLGGAVLAVLLCFAPTATVWAASASPTGRIVSSQSFKDIQSSFAYWDILQLAQAGIVSVPTNGLFHPNAPVTRLDFALWLARALQLAPSSKPLTFQDASQVPAADRGLVAAAVADHLLRGESGNLLAPQQPIRRIEVLELFGRELESKGQRPDPRYFQLWADAASIPSWAQAATIPMEDHLVYGEPTQDGHLCQPSACLVPYAQTTRAQAAVLIVRYLRYLTQHFHRPPLPQARATGFVMGFWDSGTPKAYQNLTAHGGGINLLVDGGYNIVPGGRLSGFDNTQTLEWAARHRGTQVWMMVQSMSPAQNAFLGNPQQEAAIIQSAVAAVRRAGYAGVNFDIEVPPASEQVAFTDFITQAAAALHAVGAKISVDVTVPIKLNPSSPVVGPYNYAALGAVCDQVILMTYSYHWPGSWPGPVAPLAWDQAALAFATHYMPASKVILGLPAYGYIWNQTTLSAGAYWVSGMFNQAGANGANVVYNPTAGEDTFQYSSPAGPQVGWFVGGRGLAARVRLAHHMNAGGVIAWRLDYGVHAWWAPWQELFATYQ